MNIFKIIDQLGNLGTTSSQTQAQTRRESLFGFENVGNLLGKFAAPAAVLAVAPTVSYGRTAETVIEVLNFALTLEYLEFSFYTDGLASGIISSADSAIFNQIKKHEGDHVSFLKNTINSLGGTPVASPVFDFTAKGTFNPFGSYSDFLALSQGFEDTGVRAYKGQAGNLMGNNEVLTAALQIHSVEARHASQVRRLRNKNGFDATNKAWITGNSRGTMPAATQAIYDGATSEANTTQGGVNLTSISSLPIDTIQEAFDEPLTKAEVLAIVGLFIMK